MYFMHVFLESLDREGMYARILFVDFSKGFDLVDHRALLHEIWAFMKPSSFGLAPFWWTGRNVSGLVVNCPRPSRLVVASNTVHAWVPFSLLYL